MFMSGSGVVAMTMRDKRALDGLCRVDVEIARNTIKSLRRWIYPPVGI
jgi:hypothetical protein